MKPTDVPLITAASSLVAADSGALFAVRRPHLESNSYTSQVFRSGAGGATRVSHGWSDSQLQATPDRAVYGILRATAAGEAAQLHVGEHPGAVRRVTDLHLGVSEFSLSDDGSRALLTARIPEPGRYGTDSSIPAAAEAPRRMTNPRYLSNGVGYFRDKPSQAFVVELNEPGLNPESLTGGEDLPAARPLAWPGMDASDPQWRPDGTASVVAGLPNDSAQPDLRSTVWLLDEQSATPLNLGDLGVVRHRWVGRDDLVFTAIDLSAGRADFVAQMRGIWIHNVLSGTTVRLTDPTWLSFTGVLAVHGDHIYATLTHDGAERLVRFPLPTQAPAAALTAGDLEFISPETHVVTSFDVRGDDVLWSAETSEHTAAIYTLGASGPELLTAVSPLPLVSHPQVITADGQGGEVHGWLAVPEGEGPFPVILNIHGGPFAQYSHAVFDETQVFTGAGYAVVYANPRGSEGRGRDWGLGVKGDFGAPALDDVLAVLDAALTSEPRLDAKRLGVQGGSYGGYTTAMMTTREHRFTAAIVERGYLEPSSFIATSDIGTYFSEQYTGTDRDAIAAQSPLNAVDHVRTPTLVMHSELDLRCPLEQAQRYFLALQRAGVESEMLVFPGENHELSRSGQPRHRVQRFEAMLDWWNRHLPTAAS